MELRFRAWHNESKTMYAFDLMDGNFGQGDGYIGMYPINEGKSTPGKWRGNTRQVDPHDCEIMQLTGFKDKNGKDIYKGDILQGANSVIYSVDFDNGSYKGRAIRYFLGDNSGDALRDFPIPFNLGDFQMTSIEIIGNIHENPELLNP